MQQPEGSKYHYYQEELTDYASPLLKFDPIPPILFPLPHSWKKSPPVFRVFLDFQQRLYSKSV